MLSLLWPLPIILQEKDWQAAARKIASNPRCARKTQRDGYLPLHHACECGAPPELIQALMEAYPESVYATTWLGRTPFDILQESPYYSFNNHKKQFEIIAAMLEGKTAQPEYDNSSGSIHSDCPCSGSMDLQHDRVSNEIIRERISTDLIGDICYYFEVPQGIEPGDRFPITMYHMIDEEKELYRATTSSVYCPTDKLAGDVIGFMSNTFTVPENIRPGETFRIEVNEEEWFVTCPSNKNAGDTVRFTSSFPPSGFPPVIANDVQ